MSTILTFELTLQSDYHVGSGHRKGTEIDSALLREANGQPALRGSLLGQMLREAARELIETEALSQYPRCKARIDPEKNLYCRQWDPEEDECLCCQVFGSPRRPRRWLFSSARLKVLPEVKLADDWGAEPVTRVRINPRLRRAEADMLFSEEIGDNRMVFEFEAHWHDAAEPDEAEIALLAAAACNMRHLGKSRRRGRGKCRVRLTKIDNQPTATDWLTKFKEEFIDKTWQPVTRTPSDRDYALPQEITAPDWQPVRIRVVARLAEPVLLARRAMAGNQFDSLTTFPGNILLGALAARVANRVDLDAPENYANFTGIFRRGWARFSFLSLAQHQGRDPDNIYPAFPAPLDVFRCKRQPHYDDERPFGDYFFALSGDELIRCEECAQKYGEDESAVESWDEIYKNCMLVGGEIDKLDPLKREEMHIRIDPTTQRVREGDLFEYVAMEAGQFLCGDIVCHNAEVWQKLSEMADLPADDQPLSLKFGKATRRGYGRVDVVLLPGSEDENALEKSSILKSLHDRLPDPKQPFTLYLASDTIIIDKWGRYPTRFEESWLTEALGMKVKMKLGFSKTRDVDGFHHYLGLPRWRDRALIAGSTVGLQVDDPLLSDETIRQNLEHAELRGIGLRRGEGYGQFVINHPVYQAVADPLSGESIKISLPAILKIKASVENDPIKEERDFCEKWQEQMEQLAADKNDASKTTWHIFEKVEFAAVARLLRSGCDLEINNLIEQIKSMGEFKWAENDLPGHLMYRKKDQNYEPVEREPKKFFREGEGRAAIKLLQKMLQALQDRNESPRLRAIGIKLLATKVAEAVDRALKKEASK